MAVSGHVKVVRLRVPVLIYIVLETIVLSKTELNMKEIIKAVVKTGRKWRACFLSAPRSAL